MIGAVVLELKSANNSSLPVVHGKWLHAAFFNEVAKLSPEMATELHEENGIKPFTVSELEPVNLKDIKKMREKGDSCYCIEEGFRFYWRVTALNEELLRLLLKIRVGNEIRVNRALFVIERILVSPDDYENSGILDENELIAQCLNVRSVTEITFCFTSPVSFHTDRQDMPLPKPELIFGSVVDKWNQCNMPIPLKRTEIIELAHSCSLVKWNGKTIRRFYGENHGITGFMGRFTFNLSRLQENEKRLCLLLAQFSVFSGVGRLTGQGMGQSRVFYS